MNNLRKSYMVISAVIAGLLAGGCQIAKPACAVIDVAHYACQYVTVQYVDDDGTVRRQQVPVAMVRDAATQARRDGVGQ